MSAPSTPHLIRCMYSDTAAGGMADVHWLAGVSVDELQAIPTALFANTTFDHVQVFVAGGNGRYLAESYSPQGDRIQFCGHGALAAACVAFHEHEPDAESLHFSNADRDWQARRSDADATGITLIYKRPAPLACAVPESVAAALGAQPLAAAEAGGPTDYLILELADAGSLRALQPDFVALSAASDRAWIVTARDAALGFVFRYFAPQYDNPEDAATGSAAVQLAAYWAPRLQAEQLSVRQLSAQGAVMQVRCTPAAVELAARVGYR